MDTKLTDIQFIDINQSKGNGIIYPVCGVLNTSKIHTHNFYEFFIVTNGMAIHKVNNVDIVIGRGTLAFIRPADVHCYDYYLTNDVKFFNLGIKEEVLLELANVYGQEMDCLLHRTIPKHIKVDEVTLHYFEELIERYNRVPQDEKSALRRLIFLTVLYHVLYSEEYREACFLPKWLSQLLDLMGRRENYVAGLSKLTELSGYSQEYVNRMFRKYLKVTPTQYINQQRLRLALELLNDHSMSVAEIAAECGFQNLSHFYQEFKKVYGTTPRMT